MQQSRAQEAVGKRKEGQGLTHGGLEGMEVASTETELVSTKSKRWPLPLVTQSLHHLGVAGTVILQAPSEGLPCWVKGWSLFSPSLASGLELEPQV